MSDEIAKPAAADPKIAAGHVPHLHHALGALHHDVNQLFSRFLNGSPFAARPGSSHVSWLDSGFPSPLVDVVETDAAFRLAVELPGVAESDIELSIAGDTLLLKGVKREEPEEVGKIVHIFERNYGPFQRSFHISDSIDRDNVSAKFDRGVLAITLPKLAPHAPRPNRIAIKIG
jgi:HSP20 family protein